MLTDTVNIEDCNVKHISSAATCVWRASDVPGASGQPTFGVFAARFVSNGNVVERAYCLPVFSRQLPEASSFLKRWLFSLSEADSAKHAATQDVDDPLVALFPFGWGLLFNQAEASKANLRCAHEVEHDGASEQRHWLKIYACRDIACGEELTLPIRCDLHDVDRRSEVSVRRDCMAQAWEHLFLTQPDTLRSCIGERSFEIDGSNVIVPSSWGKGALWHVHTRPDATISVHTSGLHGYGIKATRDIARGEIVESFPWLFVVKEDLDDVLRDYRFMAFDYEDYITTGLCKVYLGCASIYNHSEDSCATFQITHGPVRFCSSLQARREIMAGEEVFIDYGTDYWKSRDVFLSYSAGSRPQVVPLNPS